MDNINENAEYLSASGFSRLKEELLVLKDKRRKEIAERLEYAKSLGDLSENAEYQEAKEEQQLVEGRIADLEDILSRAVLISQPVSASAVTIGSTVVTKKEGNGSEDSYFIVGKQKGDVVTIHTPKGEMAYKILDIR